METCFIKVAQRIKEKFKTEWWLPLNQLKGIPYISATMKTNSMKTISIPLLFLLFSSGLSAQFLTPNISIDTVFRNGTIATIQYTYSHPLDMAATISLRAGASAAEILDFNTSNATGDLGPGILPGAGEINWDFSAYGNQDFRLQVIATIAEPVDIQSLVNAVDSNALKSYMAVVEGVRHRTGNLSHLLEVKTYIASMFDTLGGLAVQLHSFDYGGYQADNIIGKKFGISDETQVYIIDGHFDTVVDAPGADDNGSAVVGMLEAMRILSQFEFEKSIKFIGFDLEEAGTGLVGSKRYVDEQLLPPEETVGVINLEMIGYYTEEPNTQTVPGGFSTLFPDAYAALQADEFRGNFIINSSYQNSLPLAQAFNQAAAQYVPDLKVQPLHAETLLPDLLRSDHAWFWFKGIPALMITDGAEFRNPYYHSPEDKSEHLDFDFMRKVVQAVVATVAEEAGIVNGDAVIYDTDFFPNATNEITTCKLLTNPNPVTDLLFLNHQQCNFSGELQWLLYDAFGKLHHSGTGLIPGTIDMTGLPAGMYFLQLRNGTFHTVEKVIKR
jgi:hypothetical protein